MLTTRVAATGLLLGMVLILVGCEENTFQPPPPPAVGVAAPERRDVIEYVEFTGTTRESTSVDVRARVPGVLLEVRYEEGGRVEEGDPLFLIDPEPFVAVRDAFAAQVTSAQAALALAETTAERIERSAADGALSQIQALEARAAADAAAAALLVAQNELAIRQLDVDYTDVRAPISGWIERSPYRVGDLVEPTGEAGRLTTIFDDTQIHVDFSAPDRVFLRAMRRSDPDRPLPTVEIATEIDEGYPYIGRVDYVDPTVDELTGTIRIRAVVDNADRELVGGLFVRIRFAADTLEGALVVPREAIAADQIGSYVLVVGSDNVVQRRDVVLGPVAGDGRVVLSGLEGSDRVIVRGLLRARSGSAVTPQPVEG